MAYPIKSYFRNLKKQKLIYGIAIGGFAISMAVLILIVSYILQEKSVDKHLPNLANMYRIKQSNGNSHIPRRIYQTLLNAAPEIKELCLITENQTMYDYDGKKKPASVLSTNKELLAIFSVTILRGQREGLLESKNDLLITESFAKKIFGDKDPIGEILKLGDTENKEVKAVIADPDYSSSLKYDMIINLDQDLFGSTMGYNREFYDMYNAVFTLNTKVGPLETEEKISAILKPYEGFEESSLNIQPFKKVYFDLTSDNDYFSHANRGMIQLLSWIAVIILLLAVLNYINLTTAINNERYKEICIRKTSGESSRSIFRHFLLESYLSCFFALVLGIGIAALIAPLFKELFDREINVFDALNNPRISLAVVTMFILLGGLSGLIPALGATKFNPIDLLQRKVRLKNSNIRGVYNTVQLAVSICLIIGLIVIIKQIRYVKTKDVGFNKEYLLQVRLAGKTNHNAGIIKEKLLRYPNIINVSGTEGLPFSIYSVGSGSWRNNDEEYRIVNISHMNTDTSFLSTFGLELVRGRNFRPGDKEVCIINEQTYKFLQLDDLEGKTIWDTKIVGVVKDFHFKKMYDMLGFIQLIYDPEQVSHLNILVSGKDIPGSLGIIKQTLKEFEPGIEFEPVFYNDWINKMYLKEEKQAKAIKIYALMALVLSCFGLLGLSKYTAVKNTKEIGIRKVNGARVSEILILLNKSFVTWIAIAFLIAVPVAHYIMNKWLENFAYKTSLSWWIFALAGLLALGIALLTVSWQSWRAATRNPVESLKYE